MLKLKESTRTMLLELKVQNAFNGSKEDGGLSQRELTQVIAAHHAEFAFCDEAERPAFSAQAWEAAQPSGSAAALKRRGDTLCSEDFSAWYDGFLSHIDSERVSPTARSGRKTAVNISSSRLSPFSSDGTWTVPMERLQDALDASWAKLCTPLLIDLTADGGHGESTPLEVYVSYSGDRLLDLKRLVIEVDIKKSKSREQALDEMRAKLVIAMRRGYNIVFMLGNAAPKLRSRFTSGSQLPYILLEDNAEVQRVIGGAEDWRKVEWSRELLTTADSLYVVHQDFNVIALTRFAPDTYEGFLGKELPLSSMQHIKVTRSSEGASERVHPSLRAYA